MRLSTVVMTHPRRLAAARRLAASLDGADDVVVDPDPAGPPSALRTAVQAWTRCPGGATHHLVLQDDVLPADDLCAHALRAAECHPDRVIALYANLQSWNGAAARPALLAGYGWIATTPGEYFPTLATIMPCAVAHAFADYARGTLAVEHNDDDLLSRYLARHGHRTALRLPNLVDHDDQPSLMGYDLHGIRRSVVFAAKPAVDSGAPLLETLPAWPGFQRRRALLRVPPRPGEVRWRTETRARHLPLVHRTWPDVCAEAERALSRLRRLPQRRSAVRRYLRELYLAALTLGWVWAMVPRHPGADGRGEAYLGPVLRSYIETGFGYDAALAPWLEHVDALLEFASDAVGQGVAVGSAAPPRPATTAAATRISPGSLAPYGWPAGC